MQSLYEQWKRTEAYKETRAYKEAIRKHDLKLIEEENKKAEEQEQLEAIRQAEEERLDCMKGRFLLTQTEAEALDKALLTAIRGLIIITALLICYIGYEAIIRL